MLTVQRQRMCTVLHYRVTVLSAAPWLPCLVLGTNRRETTLPCRAREGRKRGKLKLREGKEVSKVTELF